MPTIPKPGDRVCLRRAPLGPFAPPDPPLTGDEQMGTVLTVTGALHVGGGRKARVQWDGGGSRAHGVGMLRVVTENTDQEDK